MPEQETTGDLDLDLEGGDEPVDDATAADDTAADGGDAGEPQKGEVDKRISDLQSKADREAARANKLEKALEKLNAGGSDASGGNDPERKALLEELRESSLDAVYGEFEELKSYGIDRALIGGSTRAEMREEATALVGLIKSVATRERNRVLKEHGIKAEQSGATRTPPKNYGEMSNEDFEKELSKIKGGGSSFW